MEQIILDYKILGNLKLMTDNIPIPKYIMGLLCKYSDIGITKEIEALNNNHINSNIEEINYIKKIIESEKDKMLAFLKEFGLMEKYEKNKKDKKV